MKGAVAAVVLVVLATACGSSHENSSRATTTVTAPLISVTVDVQLQPEGPSQHADLQCDNGSNGTGFLEGAAATKACATLADPAAVAYLRNPKPEGQVCTQVFGGPEQAHVVGKVDGQAVDVQLGRRDGCETAGWNLLKPLLQP